MELLLALLVTALAILLVVVLIVLGIATIIIRTKRNKNESVTPPADPRVFAGSTHDICHVAGVYQSTINPHHTAVLHKGDSFPAILDKRMLWKPSGWKFIGFEKDDARTKPLN